MQHGQAQGCFVRLVYSTSHLQDELNSAAEAALSLMRQQLTEEQMPSAPAATSKAQWSTGPLSQFVFRFVYMHVLLTCICFLEQASQAEGPGQEAVIAVGKQV